MESAEGLDARIVAAIIAGVISGIAALALALFNRGAQRDMQERKAAFDRELAEWRAGDLAERAEADARRAYEFEARKRLYDEVEPHFFQLFLACEASYYRVASLARSQRLGGIGDAQSWLGRDGYYLRSTVYNIFLPLAGYRLIQRAATFVDIGLDDALRTRFFLMKQAYFTFSDDFELASLAPAIDYRPDDSADPSPRQGLVLGNLDRLLDQFIVETEKGGRALSFGEFDRKLDAGEEFARDVGPAFDLFRWFDFESRPVLARALIQHGFIMRLMLFTFVRPTDIAALKAASARFAASAEARGDLDWGGGGFEQVAAIIAPYVAERIEWIAHDDYDL